MTLQGGVAAVLDGIFGAERPAALGVAVSGGGDSMALLELVHRWAGPYGIAVRAATVDHGLRAGAGAEAAMVAAHCAARGIGHDILQWRGWTGTGNLQAAARAGRRRLLAAWADSRNLDGLMLGHTADDQAETVLMRLVRGSGVDGLAGMAMVSPLDIGPQVIRPLLGLTRAALRDWLRAEGVDWAEDPSNHDTRFDRVRVRQFLGAFDVPATRLQRTAGHMRRAQATLRAAAVALAASQVREDRGDLILSAACLELDRGDSPGRLLAAAFRWIGGGTYRPDWDALRAVADKLRGGQTMTLAGVVGRREPDHPGAVRLRRETAAVTGPTPFAPTAVTGVWDGRWIISRQDGAPFGPEIVLRSLGEDGLALCLDWRGTGLPRDSLLASPSVWRDAQLIAAPLARPKDAWTARIAPNFLAFLIGD